jgi:hypothetical protein
MNDINDDVLFDLAIPDTPSVKQGVIHTPAVSVRRGSYRGYGATHVPQKQHAWTVTVLIPINGHNLKGTPSLRQKNSAHAVGLGT